MTGSEDVPTCRLILLCQALVLGLLLLLLTIGPLAAQASTPGILITEVMAANTRTALDDQGGYSDWIELHNPTDMPIPLIGYTLTDDPDTPAKWSLPAAALASEAFLLVWASGLDRVAPDGWHASFRLSRAGDYVGLFGPDGQLVDEVTFGAQETDVSLGRLRTVSDQWVAFSFPTPGAANTTRHRLRAPPGAPSVIVTPGSGLFTGPVTVQLYTPVPGSVVYYTLDGSDPTVEGQEYTAPLAVTETTVLRAVALDDGVPVSTVTTATYLVGESAGLPVLSLVTAPAHLWDEEMGIHVNAERRGRAWERPVTVEWLSPEGEVGFSVSAGLRIHGSSSRVLPKKSFRLYFRGEYGPTELAYPLFGPEPGQTYDRLVLRSRGGVRDQLVRDLHGAMGQVAARGRWVVLYLNGAYWGLYNLTERIDEAFLAAHFDASAWRVHPPSEELTRQNAYRWLLLQEWLASADLRDAAQYERAAQRLDIENFTTYIILNIWARNTDWPQNNFTMARPREGSDTRWRFFVWDADATFASTENAFERVVTGGSPPGRILASLLQNDQYRTYFAAQAERYLAGVLATVSVRERLDALAAELRPAIAAEAALQRLADSLDDSAEQLRLLTAPETLRQQFPRRGVPAAPPPLPPLPSGTRIALLVHNPDELTPGDAAVVARLATRGIRVTVIRTDEDSRHDPAQVAESHDLLLLSSSIRLLDTATRYAQTTTPLIFWEPLLLAAGAPLSPWGGTREEQTDIRIVDADHPITAGLPADRSLRMARRLETFSVAYPPSGPGVQVLAKHLTGGDAALMVAEAGAELANGQPARARTVFLFWHHDTFHWSTSNAVHLFDRAVDWALGLPPPGGN